MTNNNNTHTSTKQEIPNDVLKASKYISDLTKQTSKVGELRGAIQAGAMTEKDVYAELGELVNGKPGRVGDELIVVDLTGTGAQDAAIGQVRGAGRVQGGSTFPGNGTFHSLARSLPPSFFSSSPASTTCARQVAWDKLSQL